MKKIKIAGLLLSLFLLFTSNIAKSSANENINNVNADEALQKLIEGNQRFINNKPTHPDQAKEYVLKLTKAQHPFAVIITCSDSRVSPEIIFDQGLGDIFVIRDAGNVLDNDVLGSIEYAVKHLGVKLIMVLGHENCGAVTAAVKHVHNEGHIDYIVKAIKPAVEKAKLQKGDIVENSIKENVNLVVKDLKNSKPYILEARNKEKLKVVGAYYNLETEKVEIINN